MQYEAPRAHLPPWHRREQHSPAVAQGLPAAPQRIFLNHGEDPPRKALAAAIAEELGWARPVLPLTGDCVPW